MLSFYHYYINNNPSKKRKRKKVFLKCVTTSIQAGVFAVYVSNTITNLSKVLREKNFAENQYGFQSLFPFKKKKRICIILK